MTFEAHMRRQAEGLLDAVATHAADTTRAALEALRPLLDQVVQDLSSAAREEAETAAIRARLDAELQGEAAIAQGRAEAQAQIAAATREAQAQTAAATRDLERTRADVEARVRALERERAQHVLALDEARSRIEAEAGRAVAISAAGEAERMLLLDGMSTALDSIDVAINANEILETLIEQLGRHFATAAVFLVGAASFKGWRGRGVGSAPDISHIEVPRTIDSLLARALVDRKAVLVSDDGLPAASHGGIDGIFGTPVRSAIALPVFANGRVIAVAYGEPSAESPAGSVNIGRRIAEILIDHANRRLTVRRRASPPHLAEPPAPAYSPARLAHRVRMPDGLGVTLDGSASVLVDLSPLGAQVLSPMAMRPKRAVRMTLSTSAGELVCKGRVVWALFEQPRGSLAARYRAGVSFTDVDVQAVEAFLSGAIRESA